MTYTENPLDIISQITEFNDLHEFMKDETLDEALAYVVKLMMKPDVPPAKAQELIIRLQAMSSKFGILATTYTTILKDKAGSPNNMKKNIYYSMADRLDRLVDALKYSVRYHSFNG